MLLAFAEQVGAFWLRVPVVLADVVGASHVRFTESLAARLVAAALVPLSAHFIVDQAFVAAGEEPELLGALRLQRVGLHAAAQPLALRAP